MLAGSPPADLYGASRPDRFLRNLTRFSDAYAALMDRLIPARPLEPGPGLGAASSAWRPMVVTSRADECADVISLRLTAPDGSPLAAWTPGAHLRIELPSGLVRHYSLCGQPLDRHGYTIAVRRLEGGGGGSAEIHRTITEGSQVSVLGPRNGFPFAAEPVLLFIAGGIGITPLLPMVSAAAAAGLDWRLVYCGRSRHTMPFAASLAVLDPARVELRTDDVDGVPSGAELVGRAPDGAAVYCCGPPAMLDSVRRAADANPRVAAFRFERFTAAPILDGHPFEVSLRRSGTVLPVPADRSLLDVLRAHDPATPYSCRQGFCGTCQQRALRGTVEHRDRRLTDDERAAGGMLVCVSRAPQGERLVLDL